MSTYYKIIIEKYEDIGDGKYKSGETIYEQRIDENVTEEVICAVNGLIPE
jgi:hypothetical protein